MTKKVHLVKIVWRVACFKLTKRNEKIMVCKKVKKLGKKMEKFTVYFRMYIILMMPNSACTHTLDTNSAVNLVTLQKFKIFDNE